MPANHSEVPVNCEKIITGNMCAGRVVAFNGKISAKYDLNKKARSKAGPVEDKWYPLLLHYLGPDLVDQ